MDTLKTLILVSGEIENYEKIFHLSNNGALIISFDYFSHKALNRLNIPHYTIDNFLTDDDYSFIDFKSIDISQKWYKDKELQNYLTYDSINLGWLLEFELYFFLLEKIKFLYVLDIISKKENFDKIFLTKNLLNFSKIIFKEIPVEIISSSIDDKQKFRTDSFSIKTKIGPFPIIFNLKRNHFFFLRNFYSKYVIPFFNFILKRKFKKNSLLLIDFNTTLYKSLLNSLKKNSISPILLNRRRQAIFDRLSFNIIRETSVYIGSFDKFLTSKSENLVKNTYENFLNNINQIFSKNILEKYFQINNILFFEMIKDDLIHLCKSRFKEGIYEIYASKDFLNKTQPKIILHHYAASLQEKVIVTQARKMGVFDINFQHGCSPYSLKNWDKLNSFFGHFPIYAESMLAVWGKHSKNYALSQNFPKEKILSCGSSRYDEFFQLKKSNQILTGSIVLAIGAISQINSKAQRINVYDNFEKSLIHICKILSKIDRPKYVKLHPNISDYKSVNPIPIIREYDSTIKTIIDLDVKDVLYNSDVVITLQPSTIILEANIFEKPVITILSDDQFTTGINDEGFTKIFSPLETNDFENYLKEILENPKLRKQHIVNGNVFVDNYLLHQGNSSELTSQKLFSLLKNSNL